jgi:predicted Zn-dependent protease
MSVTMLAQAGLAVSQIAIAQSDTLSKYGSTIGALGGAAMQFGVILPYSRAHELEADKLGVDYMHQSGYDVKQSVRLWELMGAQSKGQRPPEFMSTHPDPARRADELIRYINAKGYALI